MSDIDFEMIWEDEIAEQWVNDFVIDGNHYDEISVQITDPDNEDGEGNSDVKISSLLLITKEGLYSYGFSMT